MIYDISQEVLSSRVWPGDPVPRAKRISSMDDGAVCNVTEFSMCAHNGTHVDAPLHFIHQGKSVDQLPLEIFVGDCYVAWHEGEVTAEDADAIMQKACTAGASQRILIAGKATVTAPAARVFVKAGVVLLGNESQTVGPENAPKEVHLILLGAGIVLLEGVILQSIPEGKYLLCAAPLNLGGCEGSPCRAVLIRA